MPTYEYRCPDGHDFEHFVQKISEASNELPCPVCGKPAARRMSAGAGLVFKGSGFYITDYGKDGKKDQRDRAERKHSEAAKIDAAKSEAKAEGAKGETKFEGAKTEARGEGATRPAESGAKSDAKGEGAKGDAKAEAKSAAKPDAKPAAAPPSPPKSGGKE